MHNVRVQELQADLGFIDLLEPALRPIVIEGGPMVAQAQHKHLQYLLHVTHCQLTLQSARPCNSMQDP